MKRNQAKKNWKTSLNKDDNRQNQSFFSLYDVGSFNISQEKDSIRSDVARKRSILSDSEIIEKSSQISKRLTSLMSFKLSKKIALYSPIQNEVSTQTIFEISIGMEKEVYFPRVNDSSLDFYRIDDLEQLKSGAYGVMEPTGSEPKADLDQIDLFVIPGLAFDKSGNRLGYGKSYYDRALINIPETRKFGLCYNFQLLNSVPNDQNDQKIGTLVTERGVFLGEM